MTTDQHDGIYTGTSEDSFKSVEQIKQELQERMFPDKKERSLDFERVTNYLQEGRDINKDFEIGQREAVYSPEAEYPDLPIIIDFASDMHYGSIGVDYQHLARDLEIVKEVPNFRLAGNGDEVDSFNAIFHAEAMQENPLPSQIQSRAIARKLLELDDMGRIAVISQGNHNRAGSAGGQDWYDSFLSEFRCPVFTCGGLLHIQYGINDYKLLLNHTFWGKSKLNPTNAVKRMIEYEGGGDIDIGWLGHVHQSSYEHFERGGKDVIAVVSGTFKEDDKWAAQNGIGGRGQQPGICIALYPNERRMQAFKDIRTAVDFIEGMIEKRKKNTGH
jgi:hypothetical protein